MEKLHLQPSELDALPFYEYEYTVEIYNDIMKDRKDAEEKNQKTYDNKYNMAGMKNKYKAPNPNVKMPNIKMPKI